MPTRTAPRSLRRLLVIATLIVATLATLGVTALVYATSILERTTVRAADSVESVRLAEEAEISLLMYGRTEDPVVQHGIESQLRGMLGAARTYAASEDDARSLAEAGARIDEYLAASRDPGVSKNRLRGAESQAVGALEALSDVNVTQARDAHARASVVTHTANAVGIALGLAIVAVPALCVWWFRRRVLQPLFELADTMKHFTEGERSVRSHARGPLELQEMSEQFNEMAQSIASQRDAQIAFLGGIAHDLRTPLSALRTAVDLLEAEEATNPRSARMLTLISRQIDRLTRMTGDFLDMSKIEAGKFELELAAQDISGIGRGIVELFSSERDRIELETSDEPILVVCDEVRIGQAITNLVSNALKYSPACEPVHVAIHSDHGEAVIAVADHGAGIPSEEQDRIFEPFHRSGRTDAVPGTGLGLANVKKLVEAHGGRIEVESAPSRGSTFRLVLPLAQQHTSRGVLQVNHGVP
jgi:two-component system, OmpR family, sensor histidine kinase MtrB